ncbi:hypothetical protein G9A89_006251 [Geosiphon pyriformis]|nr:hypothetical protein G9A89_006251 [Geosiphon pyriformis]
MAYDLGTLFERTGEKICIINQFLESGNKICCAIVCFESDKMLESTFCTEPVLGGLAKLYEKKNVPISYSAAFGNKSWIQVVSNISLSGSAHFNFDFGFFSFGVLSFDGVSRMICKLNNIKLMFLALSSFSYVLTASMTADLNINADMVLDNLGLVPFFLSLGFSGVSDLGSSSSKILTTKIGSLESKLVIFKASIGSVQCGAMSKKHDTLFSNVEQCQKLEHIAQKIIAHCSKINWETTYKKTINNLNKESLSIIQKTYQSKSSDHIHHQMQIAFEHQVMSLLFDLRLQRTGTNNHHLKVAESEIIGANHLGFAKALFQQYSQQLGLNNNHYSTESAFNFYVNDKITDCLRRTVNIEAARENFYTELF